MLINSKEELKSKSGGVIKSNTNTDLILVNCGGLTFFLSLALIGFVFIVKAY